MFAYVGSIQNLKDLKAAVQKQALSKLGILAMNSAENKEEIAQRPRSLVTKQLTGSRSRSRSIPIVRHGHAHDYHVDREVDFRERQSLAFPVELTLINAYHIKWILKIHRMSKSRVVRCHVRA